MTLFATLAAASSAGADDGGASASDPASSSGGGSSSSSSSTPPTAVQLYAGASVDFLSGCLRSDDPSDPRALPSGSGGGGGGAGGPGIVAAPSPRASDATVAAAIPPRRKFEVLSYQAVEAADVAAAASSGGASDTARKHSRPNLGVWDCRLSRPDGSVAAASGGGDVGGGSKKNDGGGEESELIDRLLAASVPLGGGGGEGGSDERAAATFVFAVDAADPHSVYPALSAMISSVLRRFDGGGGGGGTSGTTKLSKLRAASFGAAPGNSAAAAPAAVPASKDVGLNLILAVLVPSARSKKVPTFKDKQAQSLVRYHLHRLAERTDCTLAFVRADGESAEADEDAAAEGGERTAKGMPSITVSELAWVVRRVALGLPPLEKASSEGDKESRSAQAQGDEEGNTEDGIANGVPLEEAPPPLYPPGSHDPDLVNSVLLRNASCPGEWDASTDDLWKALPPPGADAAAPPPSAPTGRSKPKKDAVGGGDQAWLSELAEGVSLSTAGASDDASTAASAASGEKSIKSAKKKSMMKKSVKAKGGDKKDGAKAADPSAFFADLLKK